MTEDVEATGDDATSLGAGALAGFGLPLVSYGVCGSRSTLGRGRPARVPRCRRLSDGSSGTSDVGAGSPAGSSSDRSCVRRLALSVRVDTLVGLLERG